MPGLDDTGAACAACGAALAPDQRYCVECGQRRGRSDLPVAATTVEYDDPPTGRDRPSRWPMSTNGAFIGGIGVLLLALGVGVLIGRAGNASASKSTPPVQVVTVAAGASTPAAAAAGTPSTATGTTGAKAVTPAAAAAAASKASKAAKATTVQTSSSATTSTTIKAIETTRPLTGPNRPGYHNGKFTGNFFGP